MTQPTDKSVRGRRIQQKNRHIDRQVRIRQVHGYNPVNEAPASGGQVEPNSHRHHKVSGVTCGNSRCFMCGNPRKFFKERTMQEQRKMQDVDHVRDRHSNGVLPKDTE